MVRRQNQLGMWYILSTDPARPDKTIISHQGKKMTVNMKQMDVESCWFNWQMRGMFVQDAFRDWTPSQREFIMTGITPEEWKEIFMEREEE
jgi:hypothetical protein